jgi:anhydro-N-acetylmuramic acid kinase
MSELPCPRIDISWDFDCLPRFGHGKPRYAIGIARSESENIIRASLVRVFGTATNLVCDAVGTGSAALNTDMANVLHPSTNLEHVAASQILRTKLEIAELCAELVRSLRRTVRAERGDILAIGIDGIGVWHSDLMGQSRYEVLCHSSLLAEMTGLTVIDDFPSRDLAHGGRGGPISAVADWILLGDRSGMPGQRNQGLLRLGPTFRLLVFPSRSVRQFPPPMFAMDVCPGLDLIHAICRALRVSTPMLTKPTFAVAGRPRQAILQEWLATTSGSGKWSPRSMFDPASLDALSLERNGNNPSADDLFATAIRFFSHKVADAIKNDLARSMPIGDLLLSGPMQSCGLLIHELSSRLGGTRVMPIDYQFHSNLLDSTSAGVLAILFLDQVVSNSTCLTGTRTPRVLGRINCGAPTNWSEVASHLGQFARQPMPLRFTLP